MHVIRAPRTAQPIGSQAALMGALLVGAATLVVGLTAAWIVLTTDVVAGLSNMGSGRLGRPLGGTLVWALALLIPGVFVAIGIGRLVSVLERSMAIRSIRPRPASAIAGRLSNLYTVVQGVRLPDRRVVPEVVVGPHGILVVEELPPKRASRRHGPFWEVRLLSGRWQPIENPIERAARDAERLRRWIGSQEEQFAPRTYVAVVSDGHDLERTGAVAVLTPDQLSPYLASMPPARQMDEERRTRIVELLRRHI